MRALVIGYGNPLRGDNGVGWKAAEYLSGMQEDEEVQILAVHQLTPELAEPVSQAASVLFIDASHEGAPGSWAVEEVSAKADANALGHHFTPGGLLAYAKGLFDASPRAMVISVAAESFECGDSLSPAVSAALCEALNYVRGELGKR